MEPAGAGPRVRITKKGGEGQEGRLRARGAQRTPTASPARPAPPRPSPAGLGPPSGKPRGEGLRARDPKLLPRLGRAPPRSRPDAAGRWTEAEGRPVRRLGRRSPRAAQAPARPRSPTPPPRLDSPKRPGACEPGGRGRGTRKGGGGGERRGAGRGGAGRSAGKDSASPAGKGPEEHQFP